MRSLRAFSVGGSAPNPPGFTAFFRRNGLFLLCFKGTGSTCPPAFPAAESVARVASQHCPIPSGSGRLIINRAARALNEKAANGKYPLNFVSHIWAHRRASFPPRYLSPVDQPSLARDQPSIYVGFWLCPFRVRTNSARTKNTSASIRNPYMAKNTWSDIRMSSDR